MSTTLHSYGFGLASKNAGGEVIEVFYPQPVINPDAASAELLLKAAAVEPSACGSKALDRAQQTQLAEALAAAGDNKASELLQGMEQDEVLLCVLGQNQAPASIAEGFLKLHLISHRLARPHELNLDGLFAVLRNLAWTNEGPVDLDELPARQLAARLRGEVLDVQSVDKFPKMTNYVVPRGVRIADTARVRLGAYIGEGTTVMHEGFVNFNAGTPGHGHGRRSHFRRRGGWRGKRSGWWLLHHGYPVRWWYPDHFRRSQLSDRCQCRNRFSSGRWLYR